ncbi:MAG: peptidylprolyl isomerase [Fusobacteriaceae bacterium]
MNIESKLLKKIIVAVVAAVVIVLVVLFATGTFSQKDVAFKINGKKVSSVEVVTMRNQIIGTLPQNRPLEVSNLMVNTIAVDGVINQTLSLQYAKSLGAKVSSSAVNKEYNVQKNGMPDAEFEKALAGRGMTVASFKNELKNNLIAREMINVIKKSTPVTEEEAQQYFNANQAQFNGQNFADLKDKIIDGIKEARAQQAYVMAIESAKQSMKVEVINPEYAQIIPKNIYSLDGIIVTNGNFYAKVLTNMIQSGLKEDAAIKATQTQLQNQINIARMAMSKGVQIAQNVQLDSKLGLYQQQLVNIYKQNIPVDKNKLTDFFNKNKNGYNVPATLAANIAFIPYQASESDAKASLAQAAELLKNTTPANFVANAKKYSKDVKSAANGGDLGWIKKGVMFPELEKIAFEAEVGKVYPQIISTQLGNNIIFIKDRKEVDGAMQVNLAQIFIPNVPSEATKKAIQNLGTEISSKLTNNSIKYGELKKNYSIVAVENTYGNIKTDGSIPGLGVSLNLTKKLFESKLGAIETVATAEGVFIAQKVQEQKFVAANINDPIVAARVMDDYMTTIAVQKINQELPKFVEQDAKNIQQKTAPAPQAK